MSREICRLEKGTIFSHWNTDYLLKTFPAETTTMLSTRNSSILMMSSTEYLFWSQSVPSQSMLLRDQKLYIVSVVTVFEKEGVANDAGETAFKFAMSSRNMTSSGENGLNIRTNASPEWDRTTSQKEE